MYTLMPLSRVIIMPVRANEEMKSAVVQCIHRGPELFSKRCQSVVDDQDPVLASRHINVSIRALQHGDRAGNGIVLMTTASKFCEANR